MSSELNGLVAIITGASSGIGEATARRLAAQGAAVTLVARRKDRLEALAADIERDGGKALVITADITVQKYANEAVQETVSTFGRLDILVNNAGIMVIGPFAEADLSRLDQMIDINNRALMYMTQAAIPHLRAAASDKRRGVADIVNISSVRGREAKDNYTGYNLTKFGVNGFSEALRQELAPDHIRVAVLEPGAVRTELNDHHTDASIEKSIAEFFATIEPLEAQDIADGISYAVTRPRRMAIREIFIFPTNQS